MENCTTKGLSFERFPHSSGSRFVDVDAHKLGTVLQDVNKVKNQRENQPPLPSFHLQPVSQIPQKDAPGLEGLGKIRSGDEACLIWRSQGWEMGFSVYPIFLRDKSKHTRKKQIMYTKKRCFLEFVKSILKLPRVHFYYNLWKAQLTSTKPSLEKTVSSVSLHGCK